MAASLDRLVRFFAELKRRHVYRVAAAYAVIAWLIIQIAATALPYFEAPEWLIRTIIIVCIAGFPLALILGWVFEVTPEGVRRTGAAPSEPERAQPRTEYRRASERYGSPWARAAVVVLALTAAGLGFALWRERAQQSPGIGVFEPLQIELPEIERQVEQQLRRLEEMRVRQGEARGRLGSHPIMRARVAQDARVAILPFRVEADEAVPDELGAAIADSLRTVLDRRSEFRLVEREEVQEALGPLAFAPLADPLRGVALAAAVDASLFVHATVMARGDELMVDAGLYDGRTGTMLRNVRAAGRRDRLAALAAALAAGLMRPEPPAREPVVAPEAPPPAPTDSPRG